MIQKHQIFKLLAWKHVQGLKSDLFTNAANTKISTLKAFQRKNKAKIKEKNLLV